MAKKAKPKKTRSAHQLNAGTVDDITTQVNGLALRWIAFHKQLHGKPQTLPWDPATLDSQTSLDWTAQIASAHALNCMHCRDAIAAHLHWPNPFDPDPLPINTDEQGYLNAISNWLTTDVNVYAALWGLYFPHVPVPNPTPHVGDPSTIHEAFDRLALNGNDFVQTENRGPHYPGTINLEPTPDPPTRPSHVPELQSLQAIEVACHRLVRFHGDILNVLTHSLFALTESRNDKGKKLFPFFVK